MSVSLRFTDQAVVAIALARQWATGEGRAATVRELILGLAEEQDGAAGRLLERHASGAIVQLATRRSPPALAPLDIALRWAAETALPRPADTRDLLIAAIEVGGSELDATFGAITGLVFELSQTDDWHRSGELTSETYGLGAPGQADEMLTPVGARAVARTRAAAGGAVELVMMLADDPRDELGQWNLPPTDHLLFELERLEREGVPTAEGEAWDRGLEAVLDAARNLGPGPLPAADLLRAAVLAGGTGPLAILDAAAKPSPD